MVDKAEFEVISVGDGSNTHSVFKEKYPTDKFQNERFVIPRTLRDKLHKRIRFLVVYKDKNPVTLKEPTTISAELLYIAESSHTLRSALSDLFRKPFSFDFGKKKILFILIIATVGIIGYLIYTGQIPLSF